MRRSIVQFPAMEYPLYLIETCQVVDGLMWFGAGLSAFCLKNKKERKKRNKKQFNKCKRHRVSMHTYGGRVGGVGASPLDLGGGSVPY